MATFLPFDRQVQIAFAGLDQKSMDRELAKFARKEVNKVVASGQASSVYETYVNGRRGQVEEVHAPGPVTFVFNNWPVLIDVALAELIKRSPRGRTGKFQNSFIVMSGGKLVADYMSLQPFAEVTITNAQPYVRKVEVGAMKMNVPPRVFDSAKSALSRRYGRAFVFTTQFLKLPAGIHPLIPYILKNNGGTTGRNGRFKPRKDRMAGMPITYPSIVIKPVI